ncbi:hypothetical protein PENTCL1PPCAC_10086 [Pristionchus entomophagus]|uniref:Uncharacterized protein n=1 Tax=Pristionchus entomophagus TaxID=358040 RepID=A0AAV5SX54_9BILA|nr:hypothetical protein PENTCL1PPCAC_10086 [Pristionchus entomophagus]
MPSLHQLLFLALEMIVRVIGSWFLASSADLLVCHVLDTGVFSNSPKSRALSRAIVALGAFSLPVFFPPRLLVDSPEEKQAIRDRREERKRIEAERIRAETDATLCACCRDLAAKEAELEKHLQTAKDHQSLVEARLAACARPKEVRGLVQDTRGHLKAARKQLSRCQLSRVKECRERELIPKINGIIDVGERTLSICRPALDVLYARQLQSMRTPHRVESITVAPTQIQ